ncbi:hypothetical protein LEP1GSC013_3020 [Leptospira interrogans serovar Valbuzzi str. Duyster]|nr:hypothetical protein LEP1GSC013_3020 [Leptospira interrogans serovar Valbuzzi str. Duyster]
MKQAQNSIIFTSPSRNSTWLKNCGKNLFRFSEMVFFKRIKFVFIKSNFREKIKRIYFA